jgi:hypothetical protein
MPRSLDEEKQEKSPSIYWPGIVGIFIVQAIVLLAVSVAVFNQSNVVATSTNAIQTVRAK